MHYTQDPFNILSWLFLRPEETGASMTLNTGVIILLIPAALWKTTDECLPQYINNNQTLNGCRAVVIQMT